MATIKHDRKASHVSGIRDGKQVRKTFAHWQYGDQYRQYAELLYKELLSENSNLLDLTPLKMASVMKTMTIRDLGERYIEAHLSKGRARGNESYIRVIIKKWGDRTLLQVSKGEVRSWLDLFIGGAIAKPRGGFYGAPYAQKLAIYFIRLYNWAIEADIIDRNPLAGLLDMKKKKEFARGIRARTEVITRGELLKIMRISPEWFRRIIRHAWDTGMREGEIVQLTWAQVKEDHIKLEAQDDKETAPKKIYLSQRILAQLDRIRVEALISGDSYFVYLGANGTPMRPDRISDAWRWYANKAGITGKRFHDLRRTFADRKEREGHRLQAIAKQLGHRSIRTTIENYSNVSAEEQKKLSDF